MKRLIKCPNCEINGVASILGEINDDGNFVVLRFHKGSTIISGDNLEVTCGGCGEKVYRKEVNEIRNIGFIGFRGSASFATFGTG
jgi:hypothetical protein